MEEKSEVTAGSMSRCKGCLDKLQRIIYFETLLEYLE